MSLKREAPADLLAIDNIEIAPLPDALMASDSGNTWDHGMCSCDQCSNQPVEEPCSFWTIF
jgi:hypothetical protein